MNVTRRDVLVNSIGVSAVFATAALPALGEDSEKSVFAQRGRFERLSLDYVHLKIGLPKAFSVLHISDTHLTAAHSHEGVDKQTLRDKRTRCFGGRQEEALRDSLAWARENADYVIHTGDLIDWQSEANFDLVRKYFGGNICGSMGNHEYSPSMQIASGLPLWGRFRGHLIDSGWICFRARERHSLFRGHATL